MRKWTRKERYRVLTSKDELKDLYEKKRNSVYKQTFHVQPLTGLLNDPNGFCFYQGQWHMFYQWCPWGAVHGIKYWYHVVSKDLITWENKGCALRPDTFYDNRGVFSGSAYVEKDELYLFYTGNHRDDAWNRTSYTCGARMEKDGTFTKLEKPFFSAHPAFTEHQRDPKIVYCREKQTYYIFLGVQTEDKKGGINVYASKHLTKNWEYAGQLQVPGFEDFGEMWECPCIESIDGEDVLIFSPQYLKLPGRGENIHHNIYLIGKMDYDTLTFTPRTDYRFLDYGFDFYAAQTAANADRPERVVLSAWMGLPDIHYPTEEEDWEGSLILPRELHIQGDRLMQTPVAGMEKLRCHRRKTDGTLPRSGEIWLENEGKDFELWLFSQDNTQSGMHLFYDAAAHNCTIDRSGMERKQTEVWENILSFPVEDTLKTIRIFLDHSSVEFFINDGEAVFTSHVFPAITEHYYDYKGNIRLTLWDYQNSISDELLL